MDSQRKRGPYKKRKLCPDDEINPCSFETCTVESTSTSLYEYESQEASHSVSSIQKHSLLRDENQPTECSYEIETAVSEASDNLLQVDNNDGNLPGTSGNVHEIRNIHSDSPEVEFSEIESNEAFDLQFEEIFSVLSNEAKVRDSDCLASEQEIENVVYEPEVIEHFSTVLESNAESCTEKESFKTKDSCKKALYPDSPHTLGVTILLICCFMIRFRLPEDALSYLLRLIGCILPHGHRLMGSVYHFKAMTRKYTHDLVPKILYHCSNCYSEIHKRDKICSSCHASLTRSGAIAYFLQLKLVSQLATLWKNAELCDLIRNHRFKHLKQNKEGKLTDIYDGVLYKKLFCDNGILSDPNNISFSLNTDGAPLFKSSNVSIWPVYLLVNELPLSLRKKRTNSIFYGVWISSSKPQMWSFLKPLFEELKTLESEGHSFIDFKGEQFISKCVLLTCTCDLPARALLYNHNQFNGQYSCWHCLQRGQTYKHDSGGHSHVFPYDVDNPKGPPRTVDTIRKDIDDVVKNIHEGVSKFSVNGHKGKFWFMFLKHFDMINSCVIDYMHGVCLGTVKTLMTIWFDKKNKDHDASCFYQREKVNDYLLNVKPTVFVTRIPRSLDDMPHWKSSEFRNFLLYWGIPILCQVLSQEYFAHFCLLAKAIYTLSKEGITENELYMTETALSLFVENFSVLYGERYMTLNVHQLLHLTDCVRHTGPLYVNNCFIFEDLNGFIVKQIHGTQGVETQLTDIIAMLRIPSTMYALYVDQYTDNNVIELYRELSDSISARYRQNDIIDDGINVMGTITNRNLTEEEKIQAIKFGVRNEIVKEYFKVNMFRRGFYVYGRSYSRLQKRQQHVVTIRKAHCTEFASVLSFIQSEESHPPAVINLALIKVIQKIKPLGCVWQVSEEEDKIECIPIQNIMNVNNFIKVDNLCYISPSPNRYDRD